MTLKNNTGYICVRQDGSSIHSGYNSGSPKLYRGKGHATQAANRMNRYSGRRWDAISRTYVQEKPTNPWVVRAAEIVLKEDAVAKALRKYLTENTNVEAKAVDVVLSDLMNIIGTAA